MDTENTVADTSPEITATPGSDQDRICAALFGPETDATTAPVENENHPVAVSDDTTPENTTEGEDPESVPSIAPPKSWTKAEKDAFYALPPDIQKSLSERDAERNSNISRQLNEVSQQKKAIEAERVTVIAEKSKYVSGLEQQANFYSWELQKKYGNVDFYELARTNPNDAIMLQAEYARDKAAVDAKLNEYNHYRQQLQSEGQQASVEHVREQHSKVADFIPEWRDEAKAKVIRNDMANYLTSEFNFTPQELAHLTDAREFGIAYKAMLWDKSQRELAQKRVNTAPNVQKPVTSNSDAGKGSNKLTRSDMNIIKSGNTQAKASIIAGLL